MITAKYVQRQIDMLFEPCPSDPRAAANWLQNRQAAIAAGFIKADEPGLHPIPPNLKHKSKSSIDARGGSKSDD
jgi:hypothetical protein